MTSPTQSHEPQKQMGAAAHDVKSAGQHVAAGAQEVKHAAQGAVSGVVDSVKGAVHTATDKVGQVASAANQKVDDATSVVGGHVRTVAHGIESSGKYLEDTDLKGMAGDLVGLIQRNPIPALLIGVALGYVAARALRS